MQCWLTFSGLTLTKEHLEIQLKKRIENKRSGTEAARITRSKSVQQSIDKFIDDMKEYFNEPLFVSGIIAYESEGSKTSDCRFSNSDFRLVILFINFCEKYLLLDRILNMRYRVYLHESRSADLSRVIYYWGKKLKIPKSKILLSWKKNEIKNRKNNKDYVGQMSVVVVGIPYLYRKLLAVSSIILEQCGIV